MPNKTDNPDQRRKQFLRELTKLTLKHRIWIGGCGCCGSPFLCELKNSKGERYTSRGERYTSRDDGSSLTFKKS